MKDLINRLRRNVTWVPGKHYATQLEEIMDEAAPAFEKLEAENAALKAELAAMREQKPVAYWVPKAEQFCFASPTGRPFAKAWEPLYAASGASPHPSQARELSAWRCFHCDESFSDREAAQEHFGRSEIDKPMCQMDAEYIRWLEAQHRRNVEDDTEALRSMRGWASEHEALRRRAEEEGYARGLADAQKHPEELGLAAINAKGAKQ